MRSGRTYEVFVDGKPIRLVGSTTCTLARRRTNGYTRRFGQGVELRLIREISRPESYSNTDYNFYLKACEAMDIARKKTYIEYGGLNKISPLLQAFGHFMLEAEIGKIGGRRMHQLHPDFAANQGRKNVESGQIQALGRKNAETGHLARIATPETCIKGGQRGGRTSGRMAAEKGQLDSMRVEAVKKLKETGWYKEIGRRNVESGHLASIASKGGKIGGLINGRKAAEAGQLAALRTPEHQREAGRKGGKARMIKMTIEERRKAGLIGGRVGMCWRWNIKRGKMCTCGRHLCDPS